MLRIWQLSLIVATTIFGLAAAYAYNIPMAFGFSFGLLVLIAMSLMKGLSPGIIIRSMLEGIGHTKEVIWLLLLVAIVLPCWAASGTLDEMIAWALAFVHPSYLLALSFLISLCVSMILGTSTGTLSSVGVPLIGMAVHLQVPLPFIAGAVISGAFVGDRTSPFSSAHQLIASSTDTAVPVQWRAMLPTTLAAVISSLGFYLWLDLRANRTAASFAQGIVSPSESVWQTILLLAPIVILLGSILLRLKTKYGFMLSSAAAIWVGSFLKQVALGDWLSDIWYGGVHPLTQGKGLLHMISLVALIVLAGAFNGIMEKSGMISAYIEKGLGHLRSLTAATIKTGVFGFLLCLISCTQTLPIMMCGRNILPFWKQQFRTAQLARVIADTSAVFAAMVPWNLLAVLCSTFVGLPVEQYLPYSIFLWSLPLFTALVSVYADSSWKTTGVASDEQ
ncbi:Na+/H+ antiporter NhaC family protein [Paenibacillus cremeus]|uniref:Sodium:proton antiporter n=1 Tax=Paenibacillus cremeus TaxID=2163881 RepID=A0A559KEG9_9BACL|nr:Na+/H+ antiporter NhaC family protein [Paenibacillus cremeus]TVY10520.1 sodium:proton antiporter [Paenibacillus cremeus]